MSDTLTSTLVSQISVTETFNGVFINPNSNSIGINGLNENILLTGTTTPAVSKQSSGQITMSSGSATISLESLPGLTPDETVTFAGLKVQQLKFQNPSTNANKITIAQGGSNPYYLDGATNWSIVLAPGQSVLLNLDGASSTVGSGALNIAVTGTGAQVLNIQATAG